MSQPLDKRGQLLERTKEIERTVLGAILVDNERYLDAREHITAQDLFSPAHQVVFRAISRRLDAGQPIDLAILAQDLSAAELENVGGIVWLSRLVDGVPRAMNVGAYAREVAEKATLRALERVALQIADRAQSADDDTADILETAEREILAIRDRNTRAEVYTDDQRGQAATTTITEMIDAGGGMRGVPTGLSALDGETRGLRKGNLIIVAARPSMGKTSLLQHFAIQAGRIDPVLLFSLEMSAEELNVREVTTRAGVDHWRLMHGRTTPHEQRKLSYAIEELRQGGVHVVDNAMITLGQMRAIARRQKARQGLSLVGVDYIQLMVPETTHGKRSPENRNQEISVISRGLKGLARELHVPVVALSQLSREPEKRPDKRPQLADLRESGTLEQDADVVMLLCRPNFYNDIRSKNPHQVHEPQHGHYADHYVELNLAKQRNGPTGMIPVSFFRSTTRFADWAETPIPEPQHEMGRLAYEGES